MCDPGKVYPGKVYWFFFKYSGIVEIHSDELVKELPTVLKSKTSVCCNTFIYLMHNNFFYNFVLGNEKKMEGQASHYLGLAHLAAGEYDTALTVR